MRKLVRGILWTVGIAVAIIAVARLTFVRWWRVPTNDPVLEASISPTLAGGDFILLFRGIHPKIGDLAVCPEPQVPSRVVVARIVATEGMHVTVHRGALKVDGDAAETEHACSPPTFQVTDPTTRNVVEQTCWVESFAGSTHPRGNVIFQEGHASLTTERDVGPRQAFLLSDNRQYHYDSRDFGNVQYETCKEWVFFRLWGKDGFFDESRRFTVIR